jgi:hypothetical protein
MRSAMSGNFIRNYNDLRSLQSRFDLGQMLHRKMTEGVASRKFAITIVLIFRNKKPRPRTTGSHSRCYQKPLI